MSFLAAYQQRASSEVLSWKQLTVVVSVMHTHTSKAVVMHAGAESKCTQAVHYNSAVSICTMQYTCVHDSY
jgi:hypothetical protein